VDGISRIDPDLCMGCGVCVSHCKKGAIELQPNPEKGLPLEVGKMLAG
jgi:ferredoxin